MDGTEYHVRRESLRSMSTPFTPMFGSGGYLSFYIPLPGTERLENSISSYLDTAARCRRQPRSVDIEHPCTLILSGKARNTAVDNFVGQCIVKTYDERDPQIYWTYTLAERCKSSETDDVLVDCFSTADNSGEGLCSFTGVYRNSLIHIGLRSTQIEMLPAAQTRAFELLNEWRQAR